MASPRRTFSLLALLLALAFVPAHAIDVRILGGNSFEDAALTEGDVTYDINIQRQLGSSGHWALEGAFSRTNVSTSPGTHIYDYSTFLNAAYTFNPGPGFEFAAFAGLGPGTVDAADDPQSSYMAYNVGLETRWRLTESIGLLFRSALSDRFREVGPLYQQDEGSEPMLDSVVGVVFFSPAPTSIPVDPGE